MNYNIKDDTIAAISTALSPSGIGIIRVSGPDAIQIVDGIFCFASHLEKDGEKNSEKFTEKKNEEEKIKAEKNTEEKNEDEKIKAGKNTEEKNEDEKIKAEKNTEEKNEDEKIKAEKNTEEKIKDEKRKKKLSEVKSHTIHYGKIVRDGIIYDEVLVSIMRAPNTYTREDVVEINCHGGPFVCRKVLDLVLAAGARCAEPGEFTKRAFLNGRLKLTEAEAVMDVISAENDYALRNGVAQLSGSVQKEIRTLREKILDEIAYIEAALDDPEHISLDGYKAELAEKAEKILEQMEKLIRQADNGRIMKEGVKTAIVGRPNVGKSSLLNALLGENRAIVTDIAGTTRDTLEENIYFHGITLRLIDTAGIRRTEDTVEKIGVERAVEAVSNADLVLFVVDGSEKLTREDLEIWDLVKEKKTILVKNKSDLSGRYIADDENDFKEDNRNLFGDQYVFYDDHSIMKKNENSETNHHALSEGESFKENEESESGCDENERKIMESCLKKEIPVIEISAKTLEGMDALENLVEKMFYMEKIRPDSQVYITNARQKEALLAAYESMKLVRQSISDGMPEDFFSIDLTDAYESLGKMIGETLEDDVAEQIFSKFCMGK